MAAAFSQLLYLVDDDDGMKFFGGVEVELTEQSLATQRAHRAPATVGPAGRGRPWLWVTRKPWEPLLT